jgi:hypothetical protein
MTSRAPCIALFVRISENPVTVWPDYLSQDYAGAAVRLATVTEAGASYLLFGCVELYPYEVPLPPMLPPQRRNLGPSRLVFSITPLPLSEALDWYEETLMGRLTIPRTALAVVAVPLGPEPALGRLVSPDDVPFAPTWHARPRLHRLVPPAELASPVAALAASGKPTERQKTARSWLAERLHFDLLAYDEWLGGMALLAPNPVVRAFRTRIARSQADGREMVRVHAPPRTGASTSSLSVRFREVRFGASATVEQVRLDQYGRAEFHLPEPVREVIVELQCDRRGLLAIGDPTALSETLVAISISSGGK